jgi:hypothetical protein
METYVKAKLITGKTVSGQVGPMIRISKAGLMERQARGSDEEVWHLHPWHLVADHVEIRTAGLDEVFDQMLFL